MPDNDLTLDENDPQDAQDAIRHLVRVSKLVARATIRVGKIAGAVPPGPPQDPKLLGALQSLQASAISINETVTGVLQRQ